ncbi:WD repeat-containing protein 43 isoform X2 [Drosophila hydei]|uniref:WD repeat-containing protein 43 isoform X2 n=1 Tax=Drosophila hydei TaxID=7224 RepID=A0A6J1LN11_DROHY|nr:WD repeat-containing protein 43 isoform X2 [Drosophila hydei]
MSLVKKHVLGFSSNGGKLFALIDEHGTLRIWDTESNTLKQEYKPNFQISGHCTALTWITISAPRPKKSRKSLQVNSTLNDKHCIALGTSKGTVVLYSVIEGKIDRILGGDKHDGSITSIAYDNDGHLYTVGTDGRALVWSLAEERCINQWPVGPENPLNVVFLPKSRTLAVASRQLKIFDVDKKELVETCIGHSGEINAINSFHCNNNEYVITTAKMERVISFWKIDRKGRNKASVCTLLMEDVAHSVACDVHDDGELRVASVTRNGNIHIYLLNAESLSAEKYIKPKVSLQIASDGAETVEPIHAIAAYFVKDAQRSHDILFGYGSRQLLQFERYTPNYAEKLNVIVRTAPKKLYIKNKRNEPGTEAALKAQTPIVRTNEVEYNSALPMSKKKVQNEVPMEARLQNLSIQPTKLPGGKLQSQSKTQLLMQALHSQDQTMLQSVLASNDEKTVQLTLDRLPLEYIGPLINELSTLLQGKAANVICALRWLQTLATTHTSVMMSENKEELRDKLGICLGIAEQRLHCITEALQVSGRVNLIINQMKRNAENKLNANNVLVIDEDPDATQAGENNWSDLEEEAETSRNYALDNDQMEADDDLAADEENLIETQNSSEDDNDEEGTDTDASAG